MDWKTFFAAFTTVFLAELGDKTQVATLSLTAGSPSRLAVFLGSALALTTTAGIAVLAGDLVAKVISPQWLQRIAGCTMLLLGAVFLWRAR